MRRLTFGLVQALSDLFKSVTAFPIDESLISLATAPLLEIVCRAVQRQLTAVWLSLANMLIVQLDPPSLRPSALRAVPSTEARRLVLNVVSVMLETALTFLAIPGAMEAVCDSVIQCPSKSLKERTLYRIRISCKGSSTSWTR